MPKPLISSRARLSGPTASPVLSERSQLGQSWGTKTIDLRTIIRSTLIQNSTYFASWDESLKGRDKQSAGLIYASPIAERETPEIKIVLPEKPLAQNANDKYIEAIQTTYI